MNTRADDECCYSCWECSRPTCRDERPSPLEAEGICADCHDSRAVEIAGTDIRWRT